MQTRPGHRTIHYGKIDTSRSLLTRESSAVVSTRLPSNTATHFKRLAKHLQIAPGVLLRKMIVATARVELAALEGKATEEDVLDRLAEVAAILGLDLDLFTPDQVLAAVQALVDEIPSPPADALLAKPKPAALAKPSPRPAPAPMQLTQRETELAAKMNPTQRAQFVALRRASAARAVAEKLRRSKDKNPRG